MNAHLCFAFLLASEIAVGQSPPPLDKPLPRMIEVQGSAELSVTPNEFIFQITIKERFEKKEKITLADQEKRFKDALTKIGVDVRKDLSISDLTSRFGYVPGRKRKDELGARNYRLKITDLAKVDELQDIAEDLDLAGLELGESRRSDITTLRKETKTAAVVAAKQKAAYMLEAVGEHLGRTLLIQEMADEDADGALSGFTRRNVNSLPTVSANVMTNFRETEAPLTFAKIKLHYVVLARFEIQ